MEYWSFGVMGRLRSLHCLGVRFFLPDLLRAGFRSRRLLEPAGRRPAPPVSSADCGVRNGSKAERAGYFRYTIYGIGFPSPPLDGCPKLRCSLARTVVAVFFLVTCHLSLVTSEALLRLPGRGKSVNAGANHQCQCAGLLHRKTIPAGSRPCAGRLPEAAGKGTQRIYDAPANPAKPG